MEKSTTDIMLLISKAIIEFREKAMEQCKLNDVEKIKELVDELIEKIKDYKELLHTYFISVILTKQSEMKNDKDGFKEFYKNYMEKIKKYHILVMREHLIGVYKLLAEESNKNENKELFNVLKKNIEKCEMETLKLELKEIDMSVAEKFYE
jgi:hypothetical protein